MMNNFPMEFISKIKLETGKKICTKLCCMGSGTKIVARTVSKHGINGIAAIVSLSASRWNNFRIPLMTVGNVINRINSPKIRCRKLYPRTVISCDNAGYKSV